MEKKQIVNIHVPRTSGLSLTYAMLEQFGREKIYKFGKNGPFNNNLKDFENLSKEEINSFKFITGHIPLGIHKHFENDTYHITTLRDPIERVLSIFNYESRLGLMENNLESFNKWIETSFEANNGMVKRFCGFYEEDGKVLNYINEKISIDKLEINEEYLITAVEHLNQFDLVMIMERLSESLTLLEETISIKPLYSITHLSNNTTINKDQNWKSFYKDTIISKIREHNKFDIVLYEYYMAKFNALVSGKDKDFYNRVKGYDVLREITLPKEDTSYVSVDLFNERLNNAVGSLEDRKDNDTLKGLYQLLIDKDPSNELIKNSLAQLQ